MVTVSAFEKRKNSQGEEFCVIILEGGLDIVTSRNTGRPYARVNKISIPAVFDEKTAKRMVGTQLPGIIEKKECEPFEYAIPDTGEVIQLSHTYTYNANPNLVDNVVEDLIPA
jgi:hypothetical protein